MGVKLFMHSVQLLLGDWRNALRITGLLYLFYAIPAFFIGLLTPQSVPGGEEEAAAAIMALAPLGLVSAVLLFVVFVWMAVNWHRYILLGEIPAGQLPPFNGGRIWAYALYSIGLTLLMTLLVFVFGLLISAVLMPLATTGASFLLALVPLVTLFPLLAIGYRLGPVLPAAAIGKPITFGAAWEATKGATGAIVVLALVSALASFIIDIPAVALSYLPGSLSLLAIIWSLLTGWVKAVVSVSILTTLYGHYVEKRPLAA